MEPNQTLFKDTLLLKQNKAILGLLEKNEQVLFSCIIWKYNESNTKQERNLLLTNYYLYNLKATKSKRKIALDKIEGITISTHRKSDEFVIHVPLEYDYLYLTPRRIEIIKAIEAIYLKIKGAPLSIYGVPYLHLDQCRTSTADKKKLISKIPDPAYKIRSIESVEVQPAEPSKEESEFLGFELVEVEESFNIYQSESEAKLVSLDCFKILQLIGKGSFGYMFS